MSYCQTWRRNLKVEKSGTEAERFETHVIEITEDLIPG